MPFQLLCLALLDTHLCARQGLLSTHLFPAQMPVSPAHGGSGGGGHLSLIPGRWETAS